MKKAAGRTVVAQGRGPDDAGGARHNPETRFNSREKLAKKTGVITVPAAADHSGARQQTLIRTQGMPIMKKTFLSALGLAVALAFAVPAANAQTTTTNTAPATSTTAPAATTAAPAANETAKAGANGPHKKLRKHHRHHARKHHHVKKHHVRKHHVKKHVAKQAA
ncbi:MULTISPECIES: hypothetical protein [unclassified Mesorhizobium]|uniref:hypothetical protein n=1 Tax=unclassified Mesorhizobium TaxID=325217 RepID=UPI0015E2F54A|nr:MULTISPECIES: hypothetical protein [unclassified Mesorhizobium]